MDDSQFLEIKQSVFFLPPPPPSAGFNLDSWVTPNTLIVILVLSVISFVSVLIHLLVRFLLQPSNRGSDEIDSVTALQGQLQQLFTLHDAGVDQTFIDALPVFSYRAITGVKDPFDCAVCLCGFEPEDNLRLLPECSHAFHMGCIDTWLLSHSTCPLCRASLLVDSSTGCSPLVEFGSENSSEIFPVRDLSGELIEAREEDDRRKAVVSVKLGKLRSFDSLRAEEGGKVGVTAEARRCFSMGSVAYVMDENMSLQVPIRTPLMKKQPSKKMFKQGHRPAMSESGWDSRREFYNGFEAFRVLGTQSVDGYGDDNESIGGRKKESFSLSKIWLRGMRKDEDSFPRQVVSFRFPVDEDSLKEDYGGSKVEEEVRSCNSLDSQVGTQSFARRTLGWIMGRPNKVVHASSPSRNV